MSFTNQKARMATEEEVKAPWSGGKDGKYFRCHLCGYRFKVGDYWRWIYGNDGSTGMGNISVCDSCDTSNVKEKAQILASEWKEARDGKFWSWLRYID